MSFVCPLTRLVRCVRQWSLVCSHVCATPLPAFYLLTNVTLNAAHAPRRLGRARWPCILMTMVYRCPRSYHCCHF